MVQGIVYRLTLHSRHSIHKSTSFWIGSKIPVQRPARERQLLLRVVRCLPPAAGLSAYTRTQRAGVLQPLTIYVIRQMLVNGLLFLNAGHTSLGSKR